MFDIKLTLGIVFWILFFMWAVVFVFGAGNSKVIKPFFLLMGGWVVLGTIFLVIKDINLPTWQVVDETSLKSQTGLSGLVVGALALFTIQCVGTVIYFIIKVKKNKKLT
jgi:hypothetical protein